MIDFSDFQAIEIRVGRVVRAEPYPEARKPAIKLSIDLGELGIRRSSAQLTALHHPEGLVGRQVIAVTNLPPRRVGSFVSEVLVLGAGSAGAIVLLAPEREVENGARVH